MPLNATGRNRTLFSWALGLGVCGLLAGVFGCGAAQVGSSSSALNVQFGHVFLLVEENHSYSEVIGNSTMPYLNSLASMYGLATQYYADFHPSIADYFTLTAGQPITLDDTYSGTVTGDNVVRELNTAGKSWKAYAESLPQPGYLGGDVSLYMKHHNPFVYFSDVVQQPGQAGKVVPFTQFTSDLGSGQLPNFSFIVPNILDDAHTGSLNQADSWLQQNIDPLIKSAAFQQDGLLIITFDEGDISDFSHGGGRVATVVISAKAKKKFQSTTLYQHQSTLRLILQALGISSFPGAAGMAPSMNEFFQ
jgi:phosphatidylinositol-3-phosphatase